MKKSKILNTFNRFLSKSNYVTITKRHFICCYNDIKYNIGRLMMENADVKSEKIQKFKDQFKDNNNNVDDLELNNIEILYTCFLRSLIVVLSYLIFLFIIVGIPLISIAIFSIGDEYGL